MANPQTPAQWKSRATKARGVAERMDDPLSRKMMLEIAAGYDRLAGRAAQAITSIDIYRSSNGDWWRLISVSATARPGGDLFVTSRTLRPVDR